MLQKQIALKLAGRIIPYKRGLMPAASFRTCFQSLRWGSVIETNLLNHRVTLYRAENVFARDMDIAAISLIHMDMIMQKKGYEPMTFCVWNSLT